MIPDPEMIRAQELAQAAAMVKPVATMVIGAALLLIPSVISISNLRLERKRRQAVTPEQRRHDSAVLAYRLGQLDAEKSLRKAIQRQIRHRSDRNTAHRSRIAA